MSVAVLGAGAFGTALAITLARKSRATLWGRDTEHMARDRENARRLPGCQFPESLHVTSDLGDVTNHDILLLAMPMQKLRGFTETHADLLSDKTLVACCKGVELSSGLGPVGVIESIVPNAVVAILTGPSFAADIARGLPTALTLACTDDTICASLQEELTTPTLRIYRTSDTVGAELGGALKNVVAIACGIAMGAGLGESARAALMTRGYAEMQRMAAFRGAEPETLAGLSGFGDLALTCTSMQSRNYRLGLALGSGTEFDDSATVEGAATARAVAEVAAKEALDMPITNAVAAVLDKRLDVPSAMRALLSRPLKEE